MATNKQHGRSRAFRPGAESLEGRMVLSGTVSGMDTAGDHWTLTMLGPGKVQVIKQDGTALDDASEIQKIILSGTAPKTSRLVEKVTPASGSSGKIYFQNLIEQPNHSARTGNNLGVLSIDIPDFYLADTASTTPTTATTPAASISIPDGVQTLRFGGADTTVSFATDGSSLATNATSDQFLITLGVPYANGTNIIVNSVTSNGQAADTSTNSSATATQDSVVFQVAGRLNLFEANEIDGNTSQAPAAAAFSGGTIVSSLTDPSSTLTGQIGFIRVGGNATNFSVLTNSQIANFYVGGETNNVSILAPTSIRDLYFGRGVDTTTIKTARIEDLQANRGMINSQITTDNSIGDMTLGGDVQNSTVLAGYLQGLAGVITGVENSIEEEGAYYTSALTFPTPTAQAGGTITTNIAGDVTNSVIAASDNPISQAGSSSSTAVQTFGNPQDVFLPVGRITARVEGSISNTTATPLMPNTAFYAKNVLLTHGAVAPPDVTEPPLPKPATPITLRGIMHVFPAANGNRTAPIPVNQTGFGGA